MSPRLWSFVLNFYGQKTRLALMALLASLAVLFLQASQAQATNWYVSKLGNNKDGTNWTNAWNEMNQIVWSRINAGDKVYVDGGSSQMIYNKPLYITHGGNSTGDIVMTNSSDTGRYGQVVIDGVTQSGVGVTFNCSHVRIDGLATNVEGFLIRNWGTGIVVASTAQQDLVSYSEITNNKRGVNTQGIFNLDDSIIHDNSLGNIIQYSPPTTGSQWSSYLTLVEDWIYNSSYATSTATINGLDLVGNGQSTYWGVTNLYQCVLGPCLKYGIYANTANNILQVQNCLLLDVTQAGVRTVQSCTLQNVTSFMTPHNPFGQGHNCFNVPVNTSVTNSVFYGGNVIAPAGTHLGSPNDQFKTTGNTTALSSSEVDPQFLTDVSGYDGAVSAATLEAADFTVRTGGIPTGSSVYSVGSWHKLVFGH
jgi:hypothetical protein